MSSFITKKKLIILGIFLFGIILLLCWLVNVNNREGMMNELKRTLQERAKEKEQERICLETFNLDNPKEDSPLLKNETMPDFLDSFLEYSFCRAAINNDPDECEKLKKIIAGDNALSYYKLCENLLFYNNFWNQIQLTKECKNELIQICVKKSHWGDTIQEKEEKCSALCQGFLTQDTSFCKQKFYNTLLGVAQCKALISGNKEFCDSPPMKKDPLERKICYKITDYAPIIRNGKKEDCNSLEDRNFKILCEIYFSTVEKRGYNCPSLEELKKTYCRQWAQRNN